MECFAVMNELQDDSVAAGTARMYDLSLIFKNESGTIHDNVKVTSTSDEMVVAGFINQIEVPKKSIFNKLFSRNKKKKPEVSLYPLALSLEIKRTNKQPVALLILDKRHCLIYRFTNEPTVPNCILELLSRHDFQFYHWVRGGKENRINSFTPIRRMFPNLNVPNEMKLEVDPASFQGKTKAIRDAVSKLEVKFSHGTAGWTSESIPHYLISSAVLKIYLTWNLAGFQ